MKINLQVGRDCCRLVCVVRVAVASLLVVAGCTGSIDESDQIMSLTPAQQLAQTAWLTEALPVFKPMCTMCHDGSMASANPMPPAYLAGMTELDIRDTAVAFTPQVVNLNAPMSSRVITQGLHEGPALTAPEISGILLWIQYEHDARPAAAVIETAQMVVVADGTTVNKYDLSTLGSTGSSLSFVAQNVSGDLYLTQMMLTAGPSGLSLSHPLFDSWPAATPTVPTPDPSDRYFDVVIDLAAAGTYKLGATGDATFVGFSPTDPLSIRFDAVSTK